METTEIIKLIADHKENDDYESFKELLESLDFEQLIKLKSFAKELELFCDNQLKKHFQ